MAKTKAEKERERALVEEAKARAKNQAAANQAKVAPKLVPAPTQTSGAMNPAPGSVGPMTGNGTWIPGSPGVESPRVEPFATGEQQGLNAAKKSAWRQAIIDIDKSIADLKTSTDYQQTQLEKSKVSASDQVRSDTASRGFMGSSIQDADLFDIESTARLRKEFLNTNLDTASIAAINKKSAISDEEQGWDKAYGKMQVENAAGVETNMGPWASPPTEGHWEAPTVSVPMINAPASVRPASAFAGSTGKENTAAHDPDRPNVATGAGSTKPRVKTYKSRSPNKP